MYLQSFEPNNLVYKELYNKKSHVTNLTEMCTGSPSTTALFRMPPCIGFIDGIKVYSIAYTH